MTNQLDLLITNGHILDGTGNPGYEADIGIVDGEITVMGRDISQAHADRMIDAEGTGSVKAWKSRWLSLPSPCR